MASDKRPTIAELEAILDSPNPMKIEIQPNGEIRAVDPINPPHYKAGGLEAADVCDAWELNHNLASAVEYILRADRKGDPVTDLKKAVWRLNREIARRER